MSSFVHLHVHTEYSMLDGASRIDELFAAAAGMGMPALSITDHGVMYGAIDFYRAGRRHGVKPIIGSELYVATRSRFEKSSREKDGSHHLTVVAANDEGYANLMKLVSAAHLEGFYFRPRVDRELLSQHSSGLIATSGCLASEFNQLLLADRDSEAGEVLGAYREIFGPDGFFVEIQDHGLPDQHRVIRRQIERARAAGLRLVATNDSHYTRKEDAESHDALLCIQTGSTIADPDRFKFDSQEFYLKSPAEMRALFSEVPEACDATLDIAERCGIDIEFGVLRLPPFSTPAGAAVEEHLSRLVEEGAVRRYGSPVPDAARERIEHELSIIVQMGFASYFLIVADLIGFARSRGIRVGPGRGSAAGSVVSFCLGIVDIDPLRWGLIFERFLNPGRRQMPDIDMDFDERRRGEVIEYVARTYGEDRVAQIVTFATIKAKQAIRDAARVLGFPYGIGDKLAKMYPPSILGKEAPFEACFNPKFHWPDPGRNDAYAAATDLRTAAEQDEISRRVIDIARGLEGLRRQVSVHAAGVVIGDRPLVELLPIKRADDSGGGIVTQYEMHAVEELGLLKMDFLGLRNLTVIEDTLAHLRRRGIALDIDNVALDDAATYAILGRGETVGVFQLESPGMRELCKRLAPDRFEDVMALVALYRPGPLGEGMHHEYADRKHGRRKVAFLHADLEPILGDTYGVILYQEQALRIAVDMAGYTMEEADDLRKAIGKKIAEKMRAQREKFLAGCGGKAYSDQLAVKLWEMIEHFSGYGFNKSHSCGYALIAYQTGYLKANHPVDYMAALLTSVKDKQERMTLYLAECRARGIKVHPPDVNDSDSDFTPTGDAAIRFGLSAVRNVGENVVEEIVRARSEKGAFTSFSDFVRKVSPVVLNRRVVESLAKAGAFDSIGVSRSALLSRDVDKLVVLSDTTARIVDAAVGQARAEAAGQFSLFGGAAGAPVADPPATAEVPKEILLAAEKEMLGQYVSDHPLLAHEGALRAVADARTADLEALGDGKGVTVAGLVTRVAKKFTKKGEAMAVFWLEDLDGAAEVVVFPSAYQRAAELLAGDTIVCVKGRVDLRDDEPKIVAAEISVPDLHAAAGVGPPPVSGGAAAAPAAVEQRPAPADEALVLRVSADVFRDPRFVERLKAALVAYPGTTPIRIELEGSGGRTVLRIKEPAGVDGLNSGLHAELKALLGPGAVQ